MGVVRRYIDILTIIINFPYSTCISSLFCSSIPTSLFIFKMFFRSIYNYIRPKKRLKNEQRSMDAAAKKRANTSGVGKINYYCEDIYIPPYNNTH